MSTASAQNEPPEIELMTLADVLKVVKLGRTQFWQLRKRGGFPDPVIKSPSRWRRDDVVSFLGG